ncbi:MAG: hypothetical protein GC191_09290 [Azospirillum sp.]|nr:hypothetical protein [Azospirillum sp.]
MAVMVTRGKTAFAIALAARPLHLAWGAGDPAWDTTPVTEPLNATGLVAELGRRAPGVLEYCTPLVGGSIVVPNGSFQPSGAATNCIHFVFYFDYLDAPDGVIRELGLFAGTEISGSVPGGQTYFQPGDVLDAGDLLALQRIGKINRTSAIRQSFEFVLVI